MKMLILLIAICCMVLAGRPPVMPVGYAALNGGTTGGADGKVIRVNNFYDLKRAVGFSSPLQIQVSGKLRGTGVLTVKSNKTITGLQGSSLEGAGLMVYGGSNVIIRNMTITKVVTYSNIIIKEGAHHVWIDHCDLSSDRKHGWDYYDGLLDVGRRADFVTLSWNRLHDNHIPMLIGFGDENTDDAPFLHVTVCNNFFYNVSERQPGTRFGHIHCFNNYLLNGSGYGVGITMNATVRMDNNYFENQAIPIFTEYNAKPGYVNGLGTNIYKNCGPNKISTAQAHWKPAYNYQFLLIPTAAVPAVVGKDAGATLQIKR